MNIINIETSYKDERKFFEVPRFLLTHFAPNFAKIVAHPTVLNITIKGVSGDAFSVFLGWLRTAWMSDPDLRYAYSREYGTFVFEKQSNDWTNVNGDPIMNDDVTEATLWKVAEAAIEMYIFSKTYDIPRLRVDAIDRLEWCYDTAYSFTSYGTFVSASSIRRVYEHTDIDSPVRKWLIAGFSDFFTCSGAFMTDLPHQYFIDIAENYKLQECCPGDKEPITDSGMYLCLAHEHECEHEQRGCKRRVDMMREVED